jgi:small subunit ribosomal protein S21
MPVGIIVQPNESIDRALRRFKKKYERSKVLREYRRHMVYLKPSEERRLEMIRAMRRQRRAAAEEE